MTGDIPTPASAAVRDRAVTGDALSVRALRVTFGAVRAVDGVSLDVTPGRLVGLIGPNGAGKTTLIDAVTGFVPATGQISLGRVGLAGMAPHRRARAGLGRTWQTVELFGDLTVAENLHVAARPGRRHWSRRPREADGQVAQALGALGIASLASRRPAHLSQGERKLVDLARALAAGARVLCLDEPAAGLDTAESADLGRRLRALVDRNLSVLLVDHDMGLVLGVCDEVYVLDFGRVIAHGTAAEICSNPTVIDAYLGQAAAGGGPSDAPAAGGRTA